MTVLPAPPQHRNLKQSKLTTNKSHHGIHDRQIIMNIGDEEVRKSIKTFITLLFALFLFSALYLSTSAADTGISRFSAVPLTFADQENSSEIKWYRSNADGKHYLLLPSGTDLTSLEIRFDASAPVVCNGVTLTSGEKTGVFASGGEFLLECADQQYPVVVIVSDPVATIYIDTESGSLDAIHADKDHKESGTALIYDKNGEVEYDGLLDYIKGRGNTTWTADKKPYNIKLEDKENLFDLGKSKKWCLLANRSDGTMIRNQLSFDFAEQLGVPYTSGTEQFNFYINGEYQGLYLITEKVEIDDNRIEIYDLESETEDVNDADLETYPLGGAQKSMIWNTIKYANIPNNPENITGGYLLELEKLYRYPQEASGFVTKIGQAVVVKEPEFASKQQVQYISAYYSEFEDALYSPTGYNGLGKHYSEYIDVESLAQMYILDEFTMNFDGCSSSFFLSKDIGGKLVCGPLWDFDLAFGCMAPNDLINHVPIVGDTNNLYIKTCFIGNHNEGKFGLLAQAYMHEDFQQLVSQIWEEKVVPYFDALQDKVFAYGDAIETAYVMDSIVWNNTTDANAIKSSHDSQLTSVKEFIQRRIAILDDAFSADTFYLKYDVGDYAKSIVFDNTRFKTGQVGTVKGLEGNPTYDYMKFTGWNDKPDGSGNSYQPGDSIVIDGNTTLYAQWDTDNNIQQMFKHILELIRKIFEQIQRMFELLFI